MNFPQIDPVFLRVGPLEFRWYGLMYIISFLIGYAIIKRGVRKWGLPLSQDDVADLVFSVAMGIILGGRLGYVLFYNFAAYASNPLKIFAVWEGGMSFHGGFVGAVAALLFYCRKKSLNPLELLESSILAIPVGLFFGRIGNFINGELYGRVTDQPWGMVFPGGGGVPRHPSQLYEAFLEGPLMFFLLWCGYKSSLCKKCLFWAFVALYGVFRFMVEFFREPDAQLGFVLSWLSMGQLLCLPMIIIGTALFIRQLRLNRKNFTQAVSS